LTERRIVVPPAELDCLEFKCRLLRERGRIASSLHAHACSMSFPGSVDNVTGYAAVADKANIYPGFAKRCSQFVIRPPRRRVGEKCNIFDAANDATINRRVV